MMSRKNESGADGLFTKILVHDSMLNSVHQVFAADVNDRSVDSGRHNSKRVRCGDEAVVWFEIFKPPMNDFDIGQAVKTILEGIAHFFVGMNEPDIEISVHAPDSSRRFDRGKSKLALQARRLGTHFFVDFQADRQEGHKPMRPSDSIE